MLSILWTKETENLKFSFFENYKNALNAYLNLELKHINSIEQLSETKLIFVIDEHFDSHKKFLTSSDNIEYFNKLNIKVVIFNTEKIFNSYWKHNLEIFKSIQKIKNLTYILSDALDIKKIGTPFINKQYLSKSTNLNQYVSLKEKKNEILFFGQLDGSAYNNRRQILNKISKFSTIPVTIRKSTRSLSYLEYIKLISSYKYVLNPLGSGNFLNLRYFEILELNSIPIQQYSKEMKTYNFELEGNYSLNFKSVKEINFENLHDLKFDAFKYYLEDYFFENNFSNLL